MPDIRHGYHATLASCLPDIVRDGLIPNDGSRGIWPDELPVIGFLFFCDDVEGARYYREQLQIDEPAVIPRFARPRGSRSDPHGEMMGERRSTEAVPADSIEIEVDGRWLPLADIDTATITP